MTEFYLDEKRAYPKEGGRWKLNVENPFYENAGSYTLEIEFPLDILENLDVFGSINRMDVSKKLKTFDVVVMSDSKLMLKGTAKITNVTESGVKLQLLAGNSKVRFWSRAENMYIDELRYEYTDYNYSFDGFACIDTFDGLPVIKAGSFPGKKGVFCYVPTIDGNGSESEDYSYTGLWNEHKMLIHSNDQSLLYHGSKLEDINPLYIKVSRECISPNLMYVAKWIFAYLGYTLRTNDRDDALTNSIYIANARHTTTNEHHSSNKNSADELSMAKALPHWTVEEFILELQKFLNVTIVFDDKNAAVDILANAFYEGEQDISDSVLDEYNVEMIEDEDAEANLYDSNIQYKKGEGDAHGVNMVDMEVLKNFSEVKCTKEESSYQWDAMSDEERKVTVWSTEDGQYCAKVNEESLEKVRFNYFGAIVRNPDNDDNVELKISPVATTADVRMTVHEYTFDRERVMMDPFEHKWETQQTALSLCNQYSAANKPSVWDAITDNLEEGSGPEDLMQVFLMDDVSIDSGSFYNVPYQLPFTHHDLNVPSGVVPHLSWSLALCNDKSEASVGHFHKSSKMQNRNAEHVMTFATDDIPSVFGIFIVRNKKFACKKLEVNFDSEGIDKVITGYFEEIV